VPAATIDVIKPNEKKRGERGFWIVLPAPAPAEMFIKFIINKNNDCYLKK